MLPCTDRSGIPTPAAEKRCFTSVSREGRACAAGVSPATGRGNQAAAADPAAGGPAAGAAASAAAVAGRAPRGISAHSVRYPTVLSTCRAWTPARRVAAAVP